MEQKEKLTPEQIIAKLQTLNPEDKALIQEIKDSVKSLEFAGRASLRSIQEAVELLLKTASKERIVILEDILETTKKILLKYMTNITLTNQLWFTIFSEDDLIAQDSIFESVKSDLEFSSREFKDSLLKEIKEKIGYVDNEEIQSRYKTILELCRN